MIDIKIDWLDQCPSCNELEVTVTTEKGDETWLFDGDQVKCDCGQTGEIETECESAWVNWDER